MRRQPPYLEGTVFTSSREYVVCIARASGDKVLFDKLNYWLDMGDILNLWWHTNVMSHIKRIERSLPPEQRLYSNYLELRDKPVLQFSNCVICSSTVAHGQKYCGNCMDRYNLA